MDLDKEFRISKYSEICTYCKHLHSGTWRECDAFSKIPLEIWEGENDHKKPYPGDGGFQFEPVGNED